MKNIILTTAILTSLFIITGCEYDNYKAPESLLTGTVVYNGTAVGVRSGGCRLELWQYGYPLRQKIDIYIAQDGTFSARLFDGNYKLVRLSGAPWPANNTDSISVTVKGNTSVEVPVVPYFITKNETIIHDAGVITATCTIEKLGTLNIQSLQLLVGRTALVDVNNNVQSTTVTTGLTDLSTPKTITVTLNDAMKARDYIFARIAVRTSGVTERYYSPVFKINLK